MFGLGGGELLVIFVMALIFIGPKKLPQLAKSLGKALREFQKAKDELVNEVNRQEIEDEMKELRQQANESLSQTADDVEEFQTGHGPESGWDDSADEQFDDAHDESSDKTDDKDEQKNQ